MLNGFYQSEPKVYFRDQEYFRHFLLFDGEGGAYTVSGSMKPEEALKILTKSTKSIRGEVNFGMLAKTVTLRWLASGKAVLPDGSNVHEAELAVKPKGGRLEIKSLEKGDYKEYSGTYTQLEIGGNP